MTLKEKKKDQSVKGPPWKTFLHAMRSKRQKRRRANVKSPNKNKSN